MSYIELQILDEEIQENSEKIQEKIPEKIQEKIPNTFLKLIKKCLKILFTKQTFFVICFLIFPVIEFIFGYAIKDKYDCNIQLVDLTTWLSVEAIILEISGIVTFLVISVNSYDCITTIIASIFYIMKIAEFSWQIIGLFAFFRDCYVLKPNYVNNFMWFAICTSYCIFFSQLFIFYRVKKN
jgi:hypothetical protein